MSARHRSKADTTEAVDDFLRELDHPHKDGIVLLRGTILGADRRIAEGIKWNAPSYRHDEYFATTHLREKQGFGVILHLGAKVRDVGADGLTIEDPTQMLRWLAKDRARVVFGNVADLRTRKAAFQRLLRQWIARL